MRQAWRIFNLVAAGLLVCGAAGLAGVAAALSEWNWWFAPTEQAVPADLLEDLTFEEGQTDTVHGVVGVAIPQAENKLPAAAFASPNNQPWYVPRLIVAPFRPMMSPSST